MNKIPEEKATKNEKSKIITILSSYSNGDWDEILSRVNDGIKHRLRYTSFGAHSQKELGEPANMYYVKKTIEKIYSFEWRWDYENVSIVKHMITIANSLISNQLDHYERKCKNVEAGFEFNDGLYYDVFEEVYDEKIDELIKCIERIVAEIEELSFYWEAIKEGKKSREIAELMELPVKEIYKKNDRLIYQAKKKCINN